MKKLIFLTLLTAAIFYSCSDDNSCAPCKEDNGGLVTPDLSVTLSDTQSPMTGVLEAYPCQAGSAIYYGNYIEGKLTPFPGMYYLQDGAIYGNKNRELSLPVGTYNMIYWGTPKYESPFTAIRLSLIPKSLSEAIFPSNTSGSGESRRIPPIIRYSIWYIP